MSGENHEAEPRHVKTFGVLDLDRTLLITPALVDMLLLQLHDHGFDSETIERYMALIHSQAGASLSLRDFFTEMIDNGEALYATVQQEVLSLVETEDLADDLLYPGSAELLDTLDETDVPFAILTYGNPVDQQFKLNVVRASLGRTVETLPSAVTSESNKARWIGENWEDGNMLRVPSDIYAAELISAGNVVVADDKRANLETSNPNVTGLLIDNLGIAEGSMTIGQLAAAVGRGCTLADEARHYDVQA